MCSDGDKLNCETGNHVYVSGYSYLNVSLLVAWVLIVNTFVVLDCFRTLL